MCVCVCMLIIEIVCVCVCMLIIEIVCACVCVCMLIIEIVCVCVCETMCMHTVCVYELYAHSGLTLSLSVSVFQ